MYLILYIPSPCPSPSPRVQQELMDADKTKQSDNAAKRAAHAEEVRKQVRKKEEEKIGMRRAFFEEGIQLDHEARERSVQ